MRQMAAGLLQIFVIDLLHGKILMRFADGKVLIRIVENRGALGLEIDCRLDGRALYRLTAAVDASAGAGHDFNKIDLQLAGLYLVQKLAGVLCAGGDRHTDLSITELIGCRLDGSRSAHVLKIHLFELFAE